MMLIGAENEIFLLGRKEQISQLKMQTNFWLASNLKRNAYGHLYCCVGLSLQCASCQNCFPQYSL